MSVQERCLFGGGSCHTHNQLTQLTYTAHHFTRKLQPTSLNTIDSSSQLGERDTVCKTQPSSFSFFLLNFLRHFFLTCMVLCVGHFYSRKLKLYILHLFNFFFVGSYFVLLTAVKLASRLESCTCRLFHCIYNICAFHVCIGQKLAVCLLEKLIQSFQSTLFQNFDLKDRNICLNFF